MMPFPIVDRFEVGRWYAGQRCRACGDVFASAFARAPLVCRACGAFDAGELVAWRHVVPPRETSCRGILARLFLGVDLELEVRGANDHRPAAPGPAPDRGARAHRLAAFADRRQP